MADNNIRREFSYTRPIWYNGESYPSADSLISDEYGNKTKGSIFADANGQYYTLDKDRNIFPVIPVNNLDEIVVTAQNKQILPTMFSNYLTMSNDRTKVNNLPHREYNTHLRERTERGAKEHSLWDKEHPNLSAWRDFTTAIPFGVAATSLVGGGGSALLETGMGQAAKHGLAALMENPYVAGVNDAIGLGFAGKGSYDVTQGKFTPETAMDFVGLYPAAKFLTGLTKSKKITRNIEGLLANSDNNSFIENDVPFSYKQDPLEMHYARVRAKGLYSPDRIEYYNLSENSDRNMQLMQKLSKRFNMTPEELLNAYRNHLANNGHAAALVDENIVFHDGTIPDSQLNAVLSHEVDHALHIPDEPVPENAFFPRLNYLYKDYFKRYKNTEVAARGSQLHDYFGHTGTEPITAEELQYAKEHYVKDTGINNLMNNFLWSINDYDALAKWMTKYSTGIVPLGIIGNNQLNNNE